MRRKLTEQGIAPATQRLREVAGYQTNGPLGQCLVILPDAGIVAVRMIRRSPAYDAATDGFHDVISGVRSLASRERTPAERRGQSAAPRRLASPLHRGASPARCTTSSPARHS